MNLHSRLQLIEKLTRARAEEVERKSQKRFRHVTIYEGVALTSEQCALIEYNKNVAVGGVGFRAIIIRRQKKLSE